MDKISHSRAHGIRQRMSVHAPSNQAGELRSIDGQAIPGPVNTSKNEWVHPPIPRNTTAESPQPRPSTRDGLSNMILPRERLIEPHAQVAQDPDMRQDYAIQAGLKGGSNMDSSRAKQYTLALLSTEPQAPEGAPPLNHRQRLAQPRVE